MRHHAAAAAIFVVLAIAMTWPLAPRLGHAVTDPIDPFINTWILDWDHYATTHSGVTLFDANTFYPAHDTLAYSENLYGVAILLVPFRAAGMAPVTAYNLAMLAGFAFSGFAAYLLGFRLTGSFAAGIAAGVFHAFVPFRFTHLPHLQHVFAGWVPLLVVTLLDYIDGPSWRNAFLFAAVFLMNGLTNIHWMLFGSVAICATALLFVVAGVRRWRELAFATALAAVLLFAFLAPYWRVADLSRGYAETKSFSATWSDWLVASQYSRVYASLSDPHVNAELHLFPGFLSLAIALVALIFVRRNPRGVTLGLLWIAVGVFGSFGLNGVFHSFLFGGVPGFRAIRVPARWAEIAYSGLAMLIAVSTAAASRRMRIAGVVIALAFLVELHAAPIRWYRAPIEPQPLDAWLATHATRAIAHLPIDSAGSEYTYTFRSIAHHRKMINGASGAVPPEFARLSGMSKSDPIPDGFGNELRRIGVDTLIVHASYLGKHDAATLDWLRRELTRGGMQLVARFPEGIYGDWVYRIGRFPRLPNPESRIPNPVSYQPWTFGNFDSPPGFVRGDRWFSGFAFSPYGIRRVELLFDDGRIVVPATLIPDDKLARQFPPYPQTPRPRFIAKLARPEGLARDTDVQALVTDGRGQQLRLQFYFITWE